MKKILSSILMLGALVVNTFAASQSITIPSGTMTNFPINGGSVKVTQIITTAAGTNYSTNIVFVDTPTNWLVFTNAAYSNTLSYATNYVITYTNYYGRTNNLTNIMLVDLTNNLVAATTNFFPQRVILSIPSNVASVKYDQVNYYFNEGLWVTNSGPGAVSVTITYQQ
jgi:hypothetical protein